MIRYKGEILDYYSNTLKPIVIKKSLASVENLSDRKGTSSYTFNVPRTAKNEMLFDFITEDGSLGQAFGDAEILIDLNVYERGTLYVTGFNDDDFECVFMGSDLDLMSKLQGLKLYDLFDDVNLLFLYTLANKNTNQSVISTHSNIRYYCISLGFGAIDTIGFAFNVFDLIKKMTVGYNLFCDFLQFNTIGNNLYYSTYIKEEYGVDRVDTINLNVSNVNDPITYAPKTNNITTTIANPQVGVGGEVLRIDRDTTKIKLIFDIEAIQDGSISFNVRRGTTAEILITSTNYIYQMGLNSFEVEVEGAFLNGDMVFIFLNVGLFTITRFKIFIDVADGDFVFIPETLGEETQFSLLKKVLTQFNLIMDIRGNDIYIEPQQSGIFTNTLGNKLHSFNSIEQLPTLDITDKIKWEQNIELDYLPLNNIYFKNLDLDENSGKKYKWGLFKKIDDVLYIFNNFNKLRIEEKNNEFVNGFGFAEKWENYLFCKVDDLLSNVTFQQNRSIVRWRSLIDAMFLKTLELRNNNKIKAVELYDHNGDIMTFRRKYVIRGQRYKLIEYDFDVVNKLVKAKLQIA